MTRPATTGPTAWPAVFSGVGALFVRADNDPDAQAERIPGLTWCALKVGGGDDSPQAERAEWSRRMRARGIVVGRWVYCAGPPDRDVALLDGEDAPLVVYDVEREYKADEGGHYEWAAELVRQHRRRGPVATAVTSYGAYKASIDFASFAVTGWPILAQCYDAYGDGDELSYGRSRGGPYPAAGIHRLVRRLTLVPGEAVYRPEGL